MEIYSIKHSKSKNVPYFEMRGRDLVSLVCQMGNAIPLKEIMDDKDYFVRVSVDGHIEVGYLSDEWMLD